MDVKAALPSADRQALFQETANRMGLSFAVIEKDFWVCWTLKRTFELDPIGQNLIFKGGTSLSKVFRLIERFSEDIDLSIRRDFLGAVDDQDPEQEGISKSQRRDRIDRLRAKCRQVVQEEMLPALRTALSMRLGAGTDNGHRWRLEPDLNEAGTLLFTYPSAQTVIPPAYILQQVKPEMGAGSDPYPIGNHQIRSYAAEVFPSSFSDPETTVVAMEAERSFWEKATLIHAECHRAADKVLPTRMSRHYYDLIQLAASPAGERALLDTILWERVVKHKSVYFASNWAHYETARPGTFRLVPDDARMADLRRDYAQMREMFFDEPTPFDKLMDAVRTLEARINQQP